MKSIFVYVEKGVAALFVISVGNIFDTGGGSQCWRPIRYQARSLPSSDKQRSVQFVTLLKTNGLKHPMQSITYLPSKLPSETALAGSRSPPARS